MRAVREHHAASRPKVRLLALEQTTIMIKNSSRLRALRGGRSLGLAALVATGLVSVRSASALTVDFSDLSLPAQSFYNGGPATNSAGWQSGGVTFGNSFTADWGGYWNGVVYSNVVDTATAGFGNQYAAYAGGGVGGSGIYAVVYAGSAAFFNLPAGYVAQSVALTNTTYAALDMLNGSGFSKKFGGASGQDADFLDVILTGYAGAGGVGDVTGSVTFRLADYTFPDNAADYIVSAWSTVDLTPLGSAASVRFSWAGSDVGMFGLNTPTYVALDNLTLTAIPEPSAFAALAGSAGLVVACGRRRRLR